MNDLIWRGSQEVIIKKDLERKLASGQVLRVKYGIDPTAPDIHLGRAATIRHLKQFQDMGYQIVLILGDFTARIGDTSDKESERQPLSEDQIAANVKDYVRQLGMILDMNKVEVHYNSEWFAGFDFSEFFRLSQEFSVAQMIERENYAKRFNAGKPIGLHEFLYPLLQGYDSVAVKADIEIGGSDQLFNMLAGRTVQKHYGMPEQHVITYELLLAPDGRKMSSSWGNCIWITDAPNEMFGKLMSVRDELIYDYFRLVTEIDETELSAIKKELAATKNPRDIKARMAREVVAMYHGAEHAAKAAADFDQQFKEGKLPEGIGEAKIKKDHWNLADLLLETGLVASKSQAWRVLGQGGVKLNQKVVNDEHITVKDGDILQVGKRNFKKLTFK